MWLLERIFPSDDMQSVAGAIDRNGGLHVSWGAGGSLSYGTKRPGRDWNFWNLDWVGDVGGFTSIAVDADGLPAIAYYDATNGNLKYAVYRERLDERGQRTGRFHWVIGSERDWDADEGFEVSIARTSRGTAHILHGTQTQTLQHDVLTVIRNEGEPDFERSIIHSHAWAPSLALDANDNAHLAFSAYDDHEPGRSTITYATNTSGEWVQSEIAVTAATHDTAIAVDEAGAAHVAYCDIQDGDRLKYATNASGTWEVTPVNDEVGSYVSIALGARGTVHICYGPGSLKYATNSSGQWVTETVHGRCGAAGSSILMNIWGAQVIYQAEDGLWHATWILPIRAEPIGPA